jgi:hypothetical protein
MFVRIAGSLMAAVLVLHGAPVKAQTKDQVKDKITAGSCDCLNKKIAARPSGKDLNKTEANQMLMQCMMAAAGKEVKGLQAAYGPTAFGNNEIMRQVGMEVGGQLAQSCPSFMTLSLAIAGEKESAATTSTATTTGQTQGQLGQLSTSGYGLLEIQTSKTAKEEFAWLHRFAQADELLPQLAKLQGRQVRVSWQEVEVFQPGTQDYRRLREITGIELL